MYNGESMHRYLMEWTEAKQSQKRERSLYQTQIGNFITVACVHSTSNALTFLGRSITLTASRRTDIIAKSFDILF